MDDEGCVQPTIMDRVRSERDAYREALDKLVKAAEEVIGYEGNQYSNAYKSAWPANRAEVYMNLEMAVKDAKKDISEEEED